MHYHPGWRVTQFGMVEQAPFIFNLTLRNSDFRTRLRIKGNGNDLTSCRIGRIANQNLWLEYWVVTNKLVRRWTQAIRICTCASLQKAYFASGWGSFRTDAQAAKALSKFYVSLVIDIEASYYAKTSFPNTTASLTIRDGYLEKK